MEISTINKILAALTAAALAAFVGTSVAAPPPKDGGASGGTTMIVNEVVTVPDSNITQAVTFGPIDISAYRTTRFSFYNYRPANCTGTGCIFPYRVSVHVIVDGLIRDEFTVPDIIPGTTAYGPPWVSRVYEALGHEVTLELSGLPDAVINMPVQIYGAN